MAFCLLIPANTVGAEVNLQVTNNIENNNFLDIHCFWFQSESLDGNKFSSRTELQFSHFEITSAPIYYHYQSCVILRDNNSYIAPFSEPSRTYYSSGLLEFRYDNYSIESTELAIEAGNFSILFKEPHRTGSSIQLHFYRSNDSIFPFISTGLGEEFHSPISTYRLNEERGLSTISCKNYYDPKRASEYVCKNDLFIPWPTDYRFLSIPRDELYFPYLDGPHFGLGYNRAYLNEGPDYIAWNYSFVNSAFIDSNNLSSDNTYFSSHLPDDYPNESKIFTWRTGYFFPASSTFNSTQSDSEAFANNYLSSDLDVFLIIAGLGILICYLFSENKILFGVFLLLLLPTITSGQETFHTLLDEDNFQCQSDRIGVLPRITPFMDGEDKNNFTIEINCAGYNLSQYDNIEIKVITKNQMLSKYVAIKNEIISANAIISVDDYAEYDGMKVEVYLLNGADKKIAFEQQFSIPLSTQKDLQCTNNDDWVSCEVTNSTDDANTSFKIFRLDNTTVEISADTNSVNFPRLKQSEEAVIIREYALNTKGDEILIFEKLILLPSIETPTYPVELFILLIPILFCLYLKRRIAKIEFEEKREGEQSFSIIT